MNTHHMLNTPRRLLPPPSDATHHATPLLVIGAGVAGLSAALVAAETTAVTVLVRGTLPESNSAWAQGGIAAALDETDSPLSHIEDTLIAGAGLSDAAAVEVLAWEAPALMRELAAWGVPFEYSDADHFALGLEGGHSQRRIVHVGDATGRAVVDVLIERARRHVNITMLERYQAVDLLGDAGLCNGALVRDDDGNWHVFAADATILGTGGTGALYGLTSNQPIALGDGIAMAYRAGAEVADMEFVQFHPTVFRTRRGQGFLISEATRGEGGRLLTLDGERFMPAYDQRAELAPRDIVTRGIYAAMQRTASDHVLLDLTRLGRLALDQHFPTISARCRAEGIDPATTPIPVAPAAHYLMGGIRTDLDGATSVPGLYAVGECACTGVHGANRLASNSLLECLVFGRRAARAVAERGLGIGNRQQGQNRTKNQESRTTRSSFFEPVEGNGQGTGNGQQGTRDGKVAEPEEYIASTRSTDDPLPLRSFVPFAVKKTEDDEQATHAGQPWRDELAATMQRYVGPLRTGAGLRIAFQRLAALEATLHVDADDGDAFSAANAVLAARLIVAGALLREESRGGHFRSDFAQPDAAWQAHTIVQRDHAPQLVVAIAEEEVLSAFRQVQGAAGAECLSTGSGSGWG